MASTAGRISENSRATCPEVRPQRGACLALEIERQRAEDRSRARSRGLGVGHGIDIVPVLRQSPRQQPQAADAVAKVVVAEEGDGRFGGAAAQRRDDGPARSAAR
jgi:hypothetical protein